MVNNVVNGTYTETYDLNTALGELSMLCIHTPQSFALKRMFLGFYTQYRKMKILGCDFKMVCASRQELTPDLVGLEAGSVDPRDVLNPILFKACTGESINALVDQIYNSSLYSSGSGDTSDGGTSIGQVIDSRQIAKDAYYQLLADESWRKSHPQSGITVMGLRPMVHRLVSTQPLKWDVSSSGSGFVGVTSAGSSAGVFGMGGDSASQSQDSAVNRTYLVSNGLTEMPWIDTTYAEDTNSQISSTGTSVTTNAQIVGRVPRVYMGCLILPPAILQPLYFRLQIRWHVQFKDFRPAQDVMPLIANAANPGNIVQYFPKGSAIGPLNGIEANNKSTTYFNLYHQPTSKEVNGDSPLKEYSSFETNESAEVDQIMEKVQ